jgi:hypothetical protein
MGNADGRTAVSRWRTAWLDALAFGLGLTIAWWRGWRTTDLVWSLWLSSLVVGYFTIVRTSFRVARPLGAVGLLLFFTAHFGLFHCRDVLRSHRGIRRVCGGVRGVFLSTAALRVRRAYAPCALVVHH